MAVATTALAGGQHDLTCADVPNPLPRDAQRGGLLEVIGAVLDGEHIVVVVRAERDVGPA